MFRLFRLITLAVCLSSSSVAMAANPFPALSGLLVTGAAAPIFRGLIGQGALTQVNNYFAPAALGGRQYVIAAEMDAGSVAPGDKTAIYGDAQTGPGGSDIWAFNSLAHWRVGDPDVNVQGFEFDFLNLNSDPGHQPSKLKVDLNLTNSGNFQSGYAGYVDSTCHVGASNCAVNAWHQGFVINSGAVSDTGFSVNDPSLYGAFAGRILSNGGDGILLERNTDTSPTGFFMRFVNAANNANLFRVDVNGNVVSSGVGVFALNTSPDRFTVGSSTSGNNGAFAAMGLENASTLNSVNKGVSLDFYGRDIVNNQKLTASIATVPSDSNNVGDGLSFLTRAGDANIQAMFLDGTGRVTAGMRFNAPLATPSSSSASCNTGDFENDTNYHYVCTAPATWKRVAISSF